MNTDYRIKLGFFRHYKTRKLEKKLGADGVLALIKLWEYASEFRPDGDLSGMADEDIELSIMWDTEQTLMPILVSIGFVDGQEGEYRLHDWQEHNPWAAEADERSGEARLSRLFRTNPEKAKELKAQGRTGITQEEYQEFKKPAQKYDRSTTVQRPYNDRSTDRSTPAPAPAPAPSPAPSPEKAEAGSPSVGGSRASTRARTPKTDLPADLHITSSLQAWATEHGYQENLQRHLDAFRDKATANGYRYSDWGAALRNAIRDDWAGLRKPQAVPGGGRARDGEPRSADPRIAEVQDILAGLKRPAIEGECVHVTH